MKNKTILKVGFVVVLIAILATPIVFRAVETSASNAIVSSIGQKDSAAPKGVNRVVVYYFHPSRRCRSCAVIETTVHRVIAENFVEQVKNGQVEVRAVAVDNPQNKHYIERYKLFSKAIVVSKIENGKEKKWKNLDQIWRLRTEEQVAEYLKKEIAKLL